jgi:hypothetical protein
VSNASGKEEPDALPFSAKSVHIAAHHEDISEADAAEYSTDLTGRLFLRPREGY